MAQMSEMKDAVAKVGRIPWWVKTVAPLLISAGILYYYLHNENWGALWAAMAQSYIPLAVLALVITQLCFWCFDSLATHRAIVWFHGPFSFRAIFRVKGATFLLSMVSGPLQAGGMLAFILKKTDVTIRKFIGMMLFKVGLGAWGFNVYITIATAAACYYHLDIAKHINLWIWWGLIIGGQVWLIEAWLFWHHGVNIGFSRFIVNRESEFWSAWVQAKRRHWCLMWAMTLPSYLSLFLGYYIIAVSFNIHVPFWKFMAMIPLVVGISNLPVAFGGYGTTTLAWVTFFPEYGTPERLAAISLFIPTAKMLCRAIIGVVNLPSVLKDLTNSPSPIDTDGDR